MSKGKINRLVGGSIDVEHCRLRERRHYVLDVSSLQSLDWATVELKFVLADWHLFAFGILTLVNEFEGPIQFIDPECELFFVKLVPCYRWGMKMLVRRISIV